MTSPSPKGASSNFKSKEDHMAMIYVGEISELAVVAEGEERTTWFIWMLVGCCCISGLLFGEYIHQFGPSVTKS